MRGRVAAIPFLLFLLSFPAYPQCNLAPVYSAPFRSSVLDIAVDGNDLWAATSYGVSLYDRNVDPPKLMASIAVPGVTRVVRVAGGTVYAGSGSSIVSIRKSGSGLEIFNTRDAGGTVNDLLITPIEIFAATSNGLKRIDLLGQPTQTLATSSLNVASITLSNATLYAADGDDTVERFSISGIVQSIGALSGGVKTAQVVRLNNDRVYVSDRIQKTAIYTDSGQLLTTVNGAFTSMAPLSGDVVYLSTNDPHVHAFDFTTPGTPVEVFDQSGTPAGGTINRISALQRSGNRLYAAGGDLGLLTWDITSFAAPFPVHGYNDAPATSVVAIGSSMYVSRLTGGIYEYKIAGNGALTEARHWDARTQIVRDGLTNGLLLSTTGNTALVWPTTTISPIAFATVDFGVPIDAAALVNSTIYVLSSKALFAADIADATPKAALVPLQGMKPSWLARAGSSLALAEETADGEHTSIRLLTGTSLGTPVVVDGVPPAGIAANGNTVALFTYLGITLAEMSSGTKTVIPNSTSAVALPQRLAFSGTTLLELTDTSVLAWNTTNRTLIRKFIVPAPPSAIHGGTDASLVVAAIATSDGVASIMVNSTIPTPALYAAPSGNAYYKKVAIGGKRMLLFDGRAADLFEITTAPRWIGGIRSGGLLDVAASDTAFFTLSSSGVVTSYSYSGDPLAQTTISEGGDTAPLAITTVAGSPWVSISSGCLSTGCVKKTFVLDPKSLVVTATMTGGVTDVARSGNTAVALTDMPAEVRVIDVGNAAQPNILRARGVEGTRAPTSIALNGDTIYVLGDQIYSYSAASLSGIGQQPVPFQNDPTAALRLAGNCGVMSGHTFGPLLYSLPAFASQNAPAVPAPAQSVTVQNGTAFIVTDDSLEIWAAAPLAAPARRRPGR